MSKTRTSTKTKGSTGKGRRKAAPAKKIEPVATRPARAGSAASANL
jgi:hypothetical protein